MNNTNEILERILLNMKYDSKKTLLENKNTISKSQKNDTSNCQCYNIQVMNDSFKNVIQNLTTVTPKIYAAGQNYGNGFGGYHAHGHISISPYECYKIFDDQCGGKRDEETGEIDVCCRYTWTFQNGGWLDIIPQGPNKNEVIIKVGDTNKRMYDAVVKVVGNPHGYSKGYKGFYWYFTNPAYSGSRERTKEGVMITGKGEARLTDEGVLEILYRIGAANKNKVGKTIGPEDTTYVVDGIDYGSKQEYERIMADVKKTAKKPEELEVETRNEILKNSIEEEGYDLEEVKKEFKSKETNKDLQKLNQAWMDGWRPGEVVPPKFQTNGYAENSLAKKISGQRITLPNSSSGEGVDYALPLVGN